MTALVAGALTSVAGLAGAQVSSGAELELVRQPLFYERDDRLDLRVRVENTGDVPLDGFAIQTGIHSRILNRTELHESYDGEDSAAVYVHTRNSNVTLAPGESQLVDIAPPLDAASGTVAVEGVYSMTMTLYPADLVEPLDLVTTHLIFYPEPVEEPLNMSLVVPIVPRPSRGPAGAFVRDNTENYSLEASLSPDDGWIRGLLDGVSEGVDRGLRIGLAPSPRFVEELAAMSDGYVREIENGVETVESDAATADAAANAFAQLRTLLQNEGVQPLRSPYTAPDLPTIYDTFDLEHVISQLETGSDVLEENLDGVSFDRSWLFAPGSRWDTETLEQVRDLEGGDLRTFIGSTFFDDPIDDTTESCPASVDPTSDEPGSFTCTVRVDVPGGNVPSFVRDPDLQDRFAELASIGDDALDLQRLFAETAFFHLERPGVPRRIVHATLPSHWQPRPVTAKRLFEGLARAPWLNPRTPEQGIGISVAPENQPVVKDLDELRDAPDPSYFDDIETGEALLETFIEIGPPDERVERLRRNLLVAQSRLWWVNDAETDVGHDYALATEDEVLNEFDKITINGPDTTLTSQRSAIEVNLFNDTTYPVTVDVDFEPSDTTIRIDESDTEELEDIVVEPGEAPVINVDAIADSSGIFQVRGSVLSPETREEINHRNITIRSTNFNQIALGLTFGALGFLILFYVLRVVRRRRNSPEVSAESTTR